MTVKSVQLITNSLRYGPCPEATDAIEQRLSISSNGRVWFSEKSFEQHFAGKGLCRKKQLSIGAWKAEFLIGQFTRIPEKELVKDCEIF